MTREEAHQIVMREYNAVPAYGPLADPRPTHEDFREYHRRLGEFQRHILETADRDAPEAFLDLLLHPPDLSEERHFVQQYYRSSVTEWLSNWSFKSLERYADLTKAVLQRIQEDTSSWDTIIEMVSDDPYPIWQTWLEAILAEAENRNIMISDEQRAAIDRSFTGMASRRS